MLNSTGTVVAVSVAGVFGFSSILITLYLIIRHLKHWIDPVGQTHIVRILLMVPVYSLCSWLSLLVAANTIYFDLVRDCYEAFVLYQFFSLLVHYFDSEMKKHTDGTTGLLLTSLSTHYHPYPCCCLPIITPGPEFLRTTKQFILQYVFVKPLLALIAMILQIFDLYGEGSTRVNRGYLWITIITNVSMTLSLYYLILFYDAIAEKIEQHQPLYKLLAIKLLLFFIFWQSLAIDTLYYFQVIPDFMTVAHHDILNNAIVCMEMFILSVANLWIFPYIVYRDGSNTLGNMLVYLWDQIFDSHDIVRDTKETFFPHVSVI